MARPGLTYTEVEAAAKQLQAESKLPTVDAIRNLIKSGSDTTIARHLNAWKERNSVEAQAGSIPLPLYSAVQGLWNSLKEEAASKISIYEEESTAKIEAIEKVLRRFEEQHKADQHEKNLLNVSLRELQEKSSGLNVRLQAEQIEKARLQEQSSGLERQCSQQSQELARLHDIVKQTQANLQHYQEANLKLKEAHSLERENERNEYLATKHALESQLNKISHEKAITDVVIKHSEEALAQANQIITQLRENYTTLEKTVASSNIKNALMEQTNQALLNQVSSLEDQHAALSLKLAGAFEQINLLGYKKTGLESAIQKLEDKTQALSDEKLFLMQEKSELLGQMKALQRKNA